MFRRGNNAQPTGFFYFIFFGVIFYFVLWCNIVCFSVLRSTLQNHCKAMFDLMKHRMKGCSPLIHSVTSLRFFRQDLIFSWEKSINRGICVDSQASVTESLRIISSGSLTCEVRTGGTLRLILLPKKSCMRNWLLQITSYHRNYPWKRVWGERGGTGVRAVGFQEISIMYLKKTDQITHQV